MTDNLKLEFQRKLGRVFVGSFLIIFGTFLHNTYGLQVFRNSFFFFAVIAIFVDFLRVEFNMPFFYNQFPMRPNETKGFHGTTVATIACLLALAFFDFDIAMTAICIAMYGDSVAAVFGTLAGKTGLHTHKNKTVAGSLAMLITSAAAGFIFLNNIPIIITMVIAATLLEMFTKYLSDDIIITVFTSLAGQITALILGIRPFPIGCPWAAIAWSILIGVSTLIVVFQLTIKKIKKRRT